MHHHKERSSVMQLLSLKFCIYKVLLIYCNSGDLILQIFIYIFLFAVFTSYSKGKLQLFTGAVSSFAVT